MISTHSNYRREDFYFQRQQSLRTREAKWEERIEPSRSYLDLATSGFLGGLAVVGAFVLLVM